MKTNGESNHVADLICEIARKAEGVGASKGYALAEDFSTDYSTFREADLSRLLAIKKTNGESILTENQAEVILHEKNIIPKNYSEREAWIFFIGREFLKDQVARLSEINLDSLDINPLLARALDLKDPKQILEFNLYQTVTRSIVTSWGTTLEKLLLRCGADPFSGSKGLRAGRRPDIQKDKNGVTYFLQIKSGPNTMNVDMVQSLNELITELKKTEPKKRLLLGMTYGRRDRISSQIRDNLRDFDKSTLIGRELWEFISGERNFHRKMFSLLDNSSCGVLIKPFSELLKDKIKELSIEWTNRFGSKKIDDVLENYI